jgi:taurine dioxygenase
MAVAVELDIRQLTPTIGAEIVGLDCSVPFDEATVDAVRAAWLEHLVLFFPDQDLTPKQHTAFAAQFGDVTTGHPVEPVLPEQREVLPIDSVKDRTNFWHTDVTYMKTPPTGAVLYAVNLPSVGGDTMWANTRAAYASLAAPLQAFCDGLVAFHYHPFYAQRIANGEGNEWDGEPVTQLWPVEHPVVRVHPETGAKNLFVNPQFTVGLKGFDGVQGPGLLRMLYDHMTQPQYVVRYRWQPGTLGFWDNRATMHYGIYDYGTEG